MESGLFKALLSLAEALLKLVPPVAAWFAGRSSARAAIKAAALEHASTANAIDEEVSRLDDAALRRELLGHRD